MSHPLLLQSSYIFDNSSTIDDIRQSYIDLHKETILKEVLILLKKAILSFDNDIKPELANELFQLILTCFSRYPEQFIPAFESLFKRSKDNSNYLICSVLVLSYMTRDAKCISITEYSSFVTDIINQLTQQIKISDNIELTVYGHKIPFQFKFDLIINLLLCSDLTSEIVTFLFPQIFTEINDPFKKPSLDYMMNNVFNAKLEKFLPDIILTNKEYLLSLNNEFIGRILPFLSTSIFNGLFTQIDSNFCDAETLSSNAALNYILKCKESGQKTKSISSIIRFLKMSDWTYEVLKYVNEYNFKVPSEVINRFIRIIDHKLIFEIVSNPGALPKSILEEGLLHSTNIDFISRYLETRTVASSVLFQKAFVWRVYSFFSGSKIEKINLFTRVFVDYFSKNYLNNLFDEIVFSSTYPPSLAQSQLLVETFKSFSSNYKKIFMESNHMNKMIKEVLKREIIPYNTFMKLFSIKDSYNYMVKNNLQNNILMQLIVTFSSLSFSNSSIKYLDEITVLPPKSESSYQLLLQMLDSEDNNNLFVSLNHESLSVLSAAVVFVKSKFNLKVNCLTKISIFQFIFSIFQFFNYLNCYDMFYPDNLIISKNILDLFKEGILYFSQNESIDIQKWIDFFLKDKHEDNNIQKFFIEYNVQQIKDLFIDRIIDTGFSANKEFLVNLLANERNDSISVIKCIINSLTPKDYKSIKIKKKFKAYNIEELRDIITNNIENENSSIDFILSNVLFIYYMSYEPIYIEVNNKKGLFNAICKAIDEGIINDIDVFKEISFNNKFLSDYFDVFSNQMIKNLSKIHQETNFDELIKSVLECQSLETNDNLLEALFNYMLNDESNLPFHLITSIEMCSTSNDIKMGNFYSKFLDKYYQYGDVFIKSIDRVMLYDEKYERFVYRVEYPIIEFKFNDLTIQRFIKSIKEQSDNFNAFICLKSIMCTFPFLLDNPTEIMKEVFTALDNYSLIFTENISNKLKTAISALSFLLSALNINKFIDSFIEYAFNNISTFTNSQIFCLNVCLLSILQIPDIQEVLMSKLFKYNFLEIVNSMIDRDIPEGKFKESFDCIIYFILHLYFSIIEKFKKFDKVNLLVMNEYGKIENLFSHYFDNHISIFPYQIKFNQTSLLKLVNHEIKNDELSSFILNVERVRPFWFSDTKFPVSNEEISIFIEKCKSVLKNQEQSIFQLNSFKFAQTNDAIVYLLKQKTWAFKLIVLDNTFYGFTEHRDYLEKAVNNIPKEDSYQFNSDEYLSNQIYNENFIKKFLFDEILSKRLTKIDFPDLINLLMTILNNQQTTDFYIRCMTNFLSDNAEIISAEQLIKIIQISDTLKKAKNIELCFDLILDISSRYPHRNNKSILIPISQLLFQYDTLPDKATQIVNFIFLNDDRQLFLNALKLSSKFTAKTISQFLLLQNAFDTEIKKENPSLELISNFYSFAPSVFSTRSPELCDFLQILFNKCQREPNFLSNNILIGMILKTINLITPKRNISCSYLSDSKQNQFNANKVISSRIYELFPKFFDVFLLNRKLIDQILSSKRIAFENFEVYINFPELIDFQVLFEKFKTTVHSKISKSTLRLYINLNYVLADSFDQLGNASVDTWKRSFRIEYINERGIDAGGLRRDWFTKLAKELFDPKSGFFKSSGEKLCLQPNPLSIKYPNYKNYFVFAGRFVARAIMENVCINVHLTRPFLKQILGHPLRMSDLDSIDEHYRTSLEYILKNDFDENNIEMYFALTDSLDKYKTYELIPNGSNIQITNQNKEEYVEMAMKYYLRDSMLEQIESFCQGFSSLIPHNDVKFFSPYHFNLIISGIQKIDIKDFRENVNSSYPRDSKVFNLFFECISKWNDIDLAKLLLFMTGSSQVPPDGFRHFADSGNPIRISEASDTSALPVAHTCFNTIDLPPYENLEIMDQKLRYAINECDGFLIA